MTLARYISYGMTAIGLALTVVAILLDLGPVVTLTGMFLFVAGAVKIGMVAIWQSFFRLPHAGLPQSTRIASESRRSTGDTNEV